MYYSEIQRLFGDGLKSSFRFTEQDLNPWQVFKLSKFNQIVRLLTSHALAFVEVA